MTISYMTGSPDKFLDVIPQLESLFGTLKEVVSDEGEVFETLDDAFTEDFGRIDQSNY